MPEVRYVRLDASLASPISQDERFMMPDTGLKAFHCYQRYKSRPKSLAVYRHPRTLPLAIDSPVMTRETICGRISTVFPLDQIIGDAAFGQRRRFGVDFNDNGAALLFCLKDRNSSKAERRLPAAGIGSPANGWTTADVPLFLRFQSTG
jgi:hypothetical protein